MRRWEWWSDKKRHQRTTLWENLSTVASIISRRVKIGLYRCRWTSRRSHRMFNTPARIPLICKHRFSITSHTRSCLMETCARCASCCWTNQRSLKVKLQQAYLFVLGRANRCSMQIAPRMRAWSSLVHLIRCKTRRIASLQRNNRVKTAVSRLSCARAAAKTRQSATTASVTDRSAPNRCQKIEIKSPATVIIS